MNSFSSAGVHFSGKISSITSGLPTTANSRSVASASAFLSFSG